MLQLSSLLVFVSLLVLVSYHHHVSATIIIPKHNNATDRSSLLMFKSAITSDPHGALTMQWNDTVHFCEWQGVTCGGGRRHSERVVALNLTSLDLVGVISPALANLTFLRTIELSNNSFHGPIPRELERLPRLKILKLDDNSLSGEIPRELGRCSQLRVINFTHNMLGGSIPSELGSLFSLNYLSLGYNNIEGQIPSALGNLSYLEILYFENNSISGNIPPTLGKLSILTYLNLALNNLEGAIPTSLWNLSSLEHFVLGFNQLYGSLPPDIGQLLPNLLILSVGVNKMHGHIPPSLSNASNLYNIQLGENNFGGIIPESLGRLPLTFFDVYSNKLEAKDADDWRFLTALTNCSQLKVLQLDLNNLGGMLPQSIQNLSTTLQFLTLGDNQIYGEIPSQIGNLVNLGVLNMGHNLLIGSIPDSIAMIYNLHTLDFDQNKLSGEIPSTLGNLTQLNIMFLGNNSLSGSIPARLGNCRQLTSLDLGRNKLTGSIPKEILTISSLSIGFSLAENLLTGPIPSEIGNLMNLDMLWLYGNKLSGEIPVTLGKCVVLQQLQLQNNYFEGSIPSSLRTLRGIQELDLSHNNLSGHIPTFLGDFRSLYSLNLSFNSFEGEVPAGKGVFANASGVSVLGNKMLCGGNPKLLLTSCPLPKVPKKHHSHRLTVIKLIVIAFGCLVLLLFLVAARYYLMKSRRNLAAKNVIKDQHLRISYGELVRATNGFSEENLIGFGSFGSVYKGRLEDEHDTKFVAVKVFNLQQRGAHKSFMAECDALKNIRHRNLVRILTACSSVDFRGNEFKAMVFEFMVNDNLETWLHSEENNHYESKKLNLMQRLDIAIDVASALDYLHHHGQIPIVHRDLKPSNILLDDEMVTHVGDFGLAKFLMNSIVNSTSSSSGLLKGTVGYVAPEYGVANRVSTHGDVYSYGILLLELFTAKRPTDDIFKNGLSLTKFVEMAIPEQVMDVVDVEMFSAESGMEEANRDAVTYTRTADCVASVLRVGLSCTKELAAERTDMKVVTSKLHAIRSVFLETKSIGEKEQLEKCKMSHASA